MSKRKKRLLSYIYLIAAVLALGCSTAVRAPRLGVYGRSTQYACQRAFEATVSAVDGMSRALEKSLYAEGGAMSSKLCCEVYADALAATAAMTALPFSTQELSETSAFVGTVGDWAYTLCSEAAERGFSDEERETLRELSATASALAAELMALRDEVNGGTVLLDDPARRVRTEDGAELLSARLLQGEEDFTAPTLTYDGKYGYEREKTPVTKAEGSKLLETAAAFMGCDEGKLKPLYRYEDGRVCFSCGEHSVTVGDGGVSSVTCSRLVSDCTLGLGEAEKTAGEFLRSLGYENLQLESSTQNGCLAQLVYCRTDGDASCTGSVVRLSVALDDGSLYAFDSSELDVKELSELTWTVTEQEAREHCPAGLRLDGVRRTVCQSAGDRSVACWELQCTDDDGDSVTVYIDAENARQREIVIP